MQEIILHKTLIKKGTLGSKEYVQGRISGIMYAMLGEADYSNAHTRKGVILRALATNQEYNKFISVINNLYPNVCEFNVK